MPVKTISRSLIVLLGVIVGIVEAILLYRYLPTVEESVESDGAVILVLGSASLLAGLWCLTLELRHRWMIVGTLLVLGLWLLFLAYTFMMRW